MYHYSKVHPEFVNAVIEVAEVYCIFILNALIAGPPTEITLNPIPI